MARNKTEREQTLISPIILVSRFANEGPTPTTRASQPSFNYFGVPNYGTEPKYEITERNCLNQTNLT